ncbi:MAG: transaldolase [Candidatus Latescibacterota bacterium]|nr:transaldolase [Candidatus Latescibacterota bacterium]
MDFGNEITQGSIKPTDLKVKIFADGADRDGMLASYANPFVSGFTTNPSLMKKAGVQDYVAFAHDIVKVIPDRDISFEVFADDLDEMERQARIISNWGDRIYAKIPVTNSKGQSTCQLVHRLSNDGIKVNVTAIFVLEQVRQVAEALIGGAPSCVSVFAGRIADSGVDYMPIMRQSVELLSSNSNAELIWASPREVYNVVQADQIGCHIITCTNEIIQKLSCLGKNLIDYSLETVDDFYNDARSAGYQV